jgi:hypothetical protein
MAGTEKSVLDLRGQLAMEIMRLQERLDEMIAIRHEQMAGFRRAEADARRLIEEKRQQYRAGAIQPEFPLSDS